MVCILISSKPYFWRTLLLTTLSVSAQFKLLKLSSALYKLYITAQGVCVGGNKITSQ